MDSGVFFVQMVAVGGKFRGVRGATYKVANRCVGYRLQDQDNPIHYGDQEGDKDNIYMDVYFLENENAFDFISEVKKIHHFPDYIRTAHNPTFESTVEKVQIETSKLLHILENDFVLTPPESVNFDSPIQDLSSVASGGASGDRKRKRTPSLSGRSSGRLRTGDEKLFKYQSLETPIEGDGMYSCHLFPRKYTSESLEKNPNNFVGGYHDFHNGLDGLNTYPPNVPRFVLEFVKIEGDVVVVDTEKREKVVVRVRFRDAKTSNIWYPKFKASFKKGSVPNDTTKTIDSFMFVTDAVEFQCMLALKKTLTKNIWRREGFLKPTSG